MPSRRTLRKRVRRLKTAVRHLAFVFAHHRHVEDGIVVTVPEAAEAPRPVSLDDLSPEALAAWLKQQRQEEE